MIKLGICECIERSVFHRSKAFHGQKNDREVRTMEYVVARVGKEPSIIFSI